MTIQHGRISHVCQRVSQVRQAYDQTLELAKAAEQTNGPMYAGD